MTDAMQPGGDSAGGHDPWAPPEGRTPPAKGAGPAGAAPGQQPPSVHDQATTASVPAPGYGPPGPIPPVGPPAPGEAAAYGGGAFAVPPPPVAPTGPGVPGGYGYPAPPQGYGWPGAPMPPQNGMGTAAMVLGILSCCLFCLYGVVSVVLGILAVVFGVKGRRRAERGEAANHGQAVAGLITGAIGIVLGLAVIVLIVIGITFAINEERESDPYYGAARPGPVAAATDR
ncbi:hypothetical protein SUDANB58_04296 [Streptomyces sp. enrichment culture]|uniref:DUF4190 domain-containing protein n=1 Tax=Streptomyces sp. enrichment culture TaxID=1795815 RepID=UPI003F575FAF